MLEPLCSMQHRVTKRVPARQGYIMRRAHTSQATPWSATLLYRQLHSGAGERQARSGYSCAWQQLGQARMHCCSHTAPVHLQALGNHSTSKCQPPTLPWVESSTAPEYELVRAHQEAHTCRAHQQQRRAHQGVAQRAAHHNVHWAGGEEGEAGGVCV